MHERRRTLSPKPGGRFQFGAVQSRQRDRDVGVKGVKPLPDKGKTEMGIIVINVRKV